MAGKYMLINETDDESRVAVIEDNLLQEMLIEHRAQEQIKGNIYKGTVVQVQPSVQAAFIDFGDAKHGFLPYSEVNPHIYPNRHSGPRNSIQSRLKVGQSVMVQVTRESVDHKGAAMSTYITLPGRFMVLMPHSDKGGVSKKIEMGDERDRLKSFLTGIDAEKHAVIIRTAGVGRSLNELKKDYTMIKKTWERIQEVYNKAGQSGLIQEEIDVVTRTLRDYYTDDVEEVWVDNPETFQKALNFLKENSPRKQKALKLFVGDRSLFASYNIERQVEQLTSREVKLRSGGSIVIEQTEAMVSIDVNSGRSNQEGSIDDTAVRTNLEASEEIARQLRLRNLGGLIVIDFIDMLKDDSRKEVEQLLSDSMSRDKAQHKQGNISSFGLLEMSRQRMAIRISNVVELTCPVCAGKGKVPSLLASTNLILRTVRELAAKGGLEKIEASLPLELANHLLNERRQSIMDLELEFDISIELIADPELNVFDDDCLTPIYKGRPKPQQQRPRGRGRGQNERQQKRDDQLKREEQQKLRVKARRGPENDELKEIEDEIAEAKEVTAHSTGETSVTEAAPVETSEIAEVSETSEAASSDQSEKREDRNRGRGRGRGRGRRPEADQVETTESTEPEATFTEEAVETVVEKPAPVASKPKSDKPAEESYLTEAATGMSTLHENCLFPEYKVIKGDELEVITSAFDLRLKGKVDNAAPAKIAERYLWRLSDEEEKKRIILPDNLREILIKNRVVADPEVEESAPETTEAAEPVVEEVKEEKPKKAPAKRGRKPKAKVETTEGETEEVAEEKPKKKPGRKPAAKKAKPATDDVESKEEEKPKKKPAKKAATKKVAAKKAADDSSDEEKPKKATRKKAAPKKTAAKKK